MEKTVTIQPDGRNLMEILAGQFYELPSFCAGRGTCGKCKVRVLQEGAESTELACQYVPKKECQVVLPEDSSFQIETWRAERQIAEYNEKESRNRQIVIDIGTTTLAMLLLDAQGEVLSDWTGLNPQRKYGADVISRIEKAGRGQKQELTNSIRREILAGMTALCSTDSGTETNGQTTVSRVVIAGNTAMQHLFAGYPVDGLGSYPFQPYRTELISGTLTEFYPALPGPLGMAEYVLMPCISAFVGGDIMAGMLEAEQQEAAETLREENYRRGKWLLLDVGTNGEMVLYSDGIYFTASTAAGPVFEGGNISWGTGSIAGAIDHVWAEEGELRFTTIGGKAPVGICGTGLIESMAALRQIGILDRDGLLKGYTEKGYVLARNRAGEMITITQEDVRQFQLAKAAIRTGIEILCKTAGIGVQKLDRVYLAGGFGTRLDTAKSCEIGLLPRIVRKKCQAIGNTSLKGCRIYCMEERAGEILKEMQEKSRNVTLALEESFQKQYLEYMQF